MPRDLALGNGNLLVAFDKDYQLRELFYPHVGEENHTLGNPSLLGLFVDGQLSWVHSGWKIERNYCSDSLVTEVTLTHEALKIRLHVHDCVDFHENIFLREFTLENLSDQEREIKLFLTMNFSIYGNAIGDTAEYRPEIKALLHYKRERYFLINIYANQKYGIDLFATGKKESENFEGSFRDAEDGILSQNPIEQGSVDSICAIPFKIKAKEKESAYTWIAVGKNWEEVKHLDALIRKKGPKELIKRTYDYWKLWVNKEKVNPLLIPEDILSLYKRSLLITRTQINNCGSIIAGNDSDVIQFNRDTYSYMWPRDGALVANSLDMAGYFDLTRPFFNLLAKIIEPEGYFLHKYNPSGSLASSWHPWEKNSKPQLPIQEDETALVIWALWQHYEITKDIEFIKPLYKPLIKRAADFMMSYQDLNTHLPLPSYDLWEEKQGILTFTLSTVIGGLRAAANFTEAFGETELAAEYRLGASRILEAMDKYLYLEKEGRFATAIQKKDKEHYEVDKTIDASLFGLFAFGAYSPFDERVKSTMKQVKEKLWCQTPVGGICRYENDNYYRKKNNASSNPWFITTLWLAQYEIAIAKEEKDLDSALELMRFCVKHALPSGVLAEQVDPHTNEPLSVSPLTWSHATFISTVQQYLNKRLEINKCAICGQDKYKKYL